MAGKSHLLNLKGSGGNPEPWKGPNDPRPNVARRLTVKRCFCPPSGVANLGLETKTQKICLKNSDQVLIFSAGAQVDVEGFDEVEDGTRWKIDILRVLKPGDLTF